MSKTAIDLLTLNGASDSTSFTNYAFKADGKLNDRVRGNFTFYENNKTEDRPRRRPDPAAGNDVGPDRSVAAVQGRRQLHRREELLRVGEGRLHRRGLHPDAGRRSRHRLLHRRRRRRPQLVLPVPEHPAAALRRRRRQLLCRQARAEVRRRMAQDAGADAADLAGQPLRLELGHLSQHARAGGARLSGEHGRQVHQRLRHRHDLARSPDADRRRPVRPSVVVARGRRPCRRLPASKRSCRR